MTKVNDIPNILIVDDIAANLKVLGGILKNEGYKIRPVLNGELALQVAEKEKPDLVLLDIMMPGLDGYEVCRRLKANPELKEIPVIFISALSDTNNLVKAFNCGGVDYITKPFQAEEVSIRIATHLNLRRQNKELLELNATKDKFFSIIAHDLRGPIGNMLLISEVIAEKGSVDEDTLYNFLEMQKQLSKETIQLLENLLIWARSNTNRIDFEPKPNDVSDIVNESAELIKIQCARKEINLNIQADKNIQGLVDANMLRLILRNLLSNAIKFTGRGGEVTIVVEPNTNDSPLFAVKDTGIGMNQEMVKNLFRIDVSNKRPGTDGEASNGIGLLLCKEFVVKHGGRIWVESKENEGSALYFILSPDHQLDMTIN